MATLCGGCRLYSPYALVWFGPKKYGLQRLITCIYSIEIIDFFSRQRLRWPASLSLTGRSNNEPSDMMGRLEGKERGGAHN